MAENCVREAWSFIACSGGTHGVVTIGNKRQTEWWVTAPSLSVAPGHVFHQKSIPLLSQGGIDVGVEELCAPYESDQGRCGIPPRG